MLRDLKLSLLHASRACGLFGLAANSRRRTAQLLILCYHGISIDDEHEWAPGLFMCPQLFEARLKQLRDGGYSVLPLADAVASLASGALPPRSVVITFDDGNVDFHKRAWPLLKSFSLPATVYLTTYYSGRNLPVFPLALSYLLWRGRGRETRLALSPRHRIAIDARTVDGRRRAEVALLAHAHDEDMSTSEKDELAGGLAAALAIDYESLRARRLLQIMNPNEVRELATDGVDFQLHTHRHRSPLDEEPYRAELATNRARIQASTNRKPTHFCYPSGTYKPQFEQWLKAEGVLSATTCEPGIATRSSNLLRLPRLLDHSTLTGVEFDAWLSGLGAVLPHRPVGSQDVDRAGRLVIARIPEKTATLRTARDERQPAAVHR